MKRCVNCKRMVEPFKSFSDGDNTRRQSGSQFYKGKRTTKHWCEPCWTQWEADYQRQQRERDAEIKRMIDQRTNELEHA